MSIVGEFPESGLVPLSFLTGIIGVTPDVKGLKVESNLPSDMTFAGVSEYWYGNKPYSIEVNRSLTEPSVAQEGGKCVVRLPADNTYYITMDSRVIRGE